MHCSHCEYTRIYITLSWGLLLQCVTMPCHAGTPDSFDIVVIMNIHISMRDERKQSRSNKQQGKATQHTQHVQSYTCTCTLPCSGDCCCSVSLGDAVLVCVGTPELLCIVVINVARKQYWIHKQLHSIKTVDHAIQIPYLQNTCIGVCCLASNLCCLGFCTSVVAS